MNLSVEKKILIRKIIVYVIFTLLFSCFQVSFPNRLTLFGQVADLMLLYVILVGYFFGFADGAVVGIIVGFIRDYFAGPSFTDSQGNVTASIGIGMLMMFIAASISSSFFTKRMNRNAAFAFVCVIFCTICYKVTGHLIMAAVMQFFSRTSYNLSFYQIVVNSILPTLLLNVIIAGPMILVLRFIGPYSKGVNPSLSKNFLSGGDDLWLRT